MNTKRKKKKILKQKGSVLIIMLLMIVVGSFFFVNGVLPDKAKPNTGGIASFFPILENPEDGKDNLQLKTINFKSCGSKTAVNFLVDRSGSMRYGRPVSKMDNLKAALRIFAESFPEAGLISLHSYSDNNYPYRNDVPYGYFGSIKTEFITEVNSLDWGGSTHTQTAFKSLKPYLADIKSKFPDRDVTLIFISDGIPETAANNVLCPGGKDPDAPFCAASPADPEACRCFDPAEDPTPIAQEIKDSGVRIFSIGYIHDQDKAFKGKLKTLMENVASTPEDFFEAPIDNQLTEILQEISSEICEE